MAVQVTPMILQPSGLDTTIKQTDHHIAIRQDSEHQGEETSQRSICTAAPWLGRKQHAYLAYSSNTRTMRITPFLSLSYIFSTLILVSNLNIFYPTSAPNRGRSITEVAAHLDIRAIKSYTFHYCHSSASFQYLLLAMPGFF